MPTCAPRWEAPARVYLAEPRDTEEGSSEDLATVLVRTDHSRHFGTDRYFEGHPHLERILMPRTWVGHPLRKDFPLGYEEVQFTFNFDDINLRKHYAKE